MNTRSESSFITSFTRHQIETELFIVIFFSPENNEIKKNFQTFFLNLPN